MRRTTVGYLVLGDGVPMQAAHTEAIEGPLFPALAMGRRPATLFPTRRAAEQAITTTKVYRSGQSLTPISAWRILRLEAAVVGWTPHRAWE